MFIYNIQYNKWAENENEKKGKRKNIIIETRNTAINSTCCLRGREMGLLQQFLTQRDIKL